MILDEVYFWTATMKDWKTLLFNQEYKTIIIDTLKELVARKKIEVYAFVIMPNHIHLVWKMIALNGKEMPYASFNKFTAHQFQKLLRINNPKLLASFEVLDIERKYRFWQRDSLAILMDCDEKLFQKIDYLHTNPLQERWNLVQCPEDYYWSSAKFYKTGVDDFGFLTSISKIF